MTWTNFGWADAQDVGLIPQAGETLADFNARVVAYDAAHPGELKLLENATLEAFGQHIYNLAVADAPGDGGGAGAVPDASTTVKGSTKLSVAPASASSPIAAGDNDPRLTDQRTPTNASVTLAKVAESLKPSGTAASTDESLRALGTGAGQAAAGNDARLPTATQKNALAGTTGTPGTGNEFVTTSDARMSDARTPTTHSHTSMAQLGSGTPASGKYLDGAGTWTTLPAGSGSGLPATVTTKTTTYTAVAGDFILADATSAAFTITLPAAPATGSLVLIKKTDATANAVNVAASGGGTIDGDAGGASITSPQFGGIFEHTGSNVWKIVGVTSAGGSNGVDGKTVRSGSGAPSAGLGVDGDFYLRTDTNGMYGPKAAGAWGSPTSLIGPAGTNGTNGAIAVIEDEGTPLTVRSNVNFAGAGVTAADSGSKTVITIPGGAGITVQDENSNVATGVTQMDFQGAGVTVSSGSGEVIITIPAGGSSLEGIWVPSQNGWLGAVFDPDLCIGSSAPNGGIMFLSKIWVPTSVTIANLILQYQTAGATLTSGQNFGMLYNSAGTLLAKTADQTTNWQTAASAGVPTTMALTAEAGQSLTLGGAGVYVYAAFYSNGTTRPAFSRGGSGGYNGGLTATTYRHATSSPTTYTTTPPSTLPTFSLSSVLPYWAAIS